jgi:hypothetical protein
MMEISPLTKLQHPFREEIAEDHYLMTKEILLVLTLLD